MPEIFCPVANIGFQLALSAADTVPKAADVIGDIRSVTGAGVSVNSTDATSVSSPDGVTRPAPTTKTVKPFTVTLYKTATNYAKIEAKILDTPVTEQGFFASITLIYPPEGEATTNPTDYTYTGFFSDLSIGDVEAEQVQTVSFQFTPIKKPTKFTAFDPAV